MSGNTPSGGGPYEPYSQPDYAGDPNDTLVIVPNGVSIGDEVAQLRAERDAYRAVLSEYADRNNWGECPTDSTERRDVWLDSFSGYTPAQRVLERFATTALPPLSA